MKGDYFVVNCVEFYFYVIILVISGIDFIIKIWFLEVIFIFYYLEYIDMVSFCVYLVFVGFVLLNLRGLYCLYIRYVIGMFL